MNMSASERRGMIALLVAFTLLAIGGMFLWMRPADEPEKQVATAAKEQPSAARQTKTYAQPRRKIEAFPFDPNTADSTQLLRLGLTPAQVRGIYKFRSMGYTYGTADDFSRVPGLTQGQWDHLAPLIRIAPEFRPVTPRPRVVVRPATVYVDASGKSSPQSGATAEGVLPSIPRQPKLQEGQQVDLNTADTTELKKVPGIGSYFARQVTDYRKRLGGFVSVEQVAEIREFPVDALPYLMVEADAPIKKLQINKASKRMLLSHPYINATLAASIWEYRHNEGPLHNADELKALPHFRPSDVEQLLPYIDFSL